MDRKHKIKEIIFLYITLVFTVYLFNDHNYDNNKYVIYEENDDAFGAYKGGKIYIGDRDYIISIKDKVKEGDILIEQGYRVDDGYNDPNYKIYSSYLIKDKDDRNAILNVLQVYNMKYPWEFNRSLDSMRVEWSVHNYLYEMGYERNRTQDVDLNNDDEKIYSNPILKRLIK